MCFHVLKAQQLNKDIFETIYYHALKASSELAKKEGPYETYIGSPVSKVCLRTSFCHCVRKLIALEYFMFVHLVEILEHL